MPAPAVEAAPSPRARHWRRKPAGDHHDPENACGPAGGIGRQYRWKSNGPPP